MYDLKTVLMAWLFISFNVSALQAEELNSLPQIGLSGDLVFDVSIQQLDGYNLNIDGEFMKHLIVTFPIISGGIFGMPDKNQEKMLMFVDDNKQIIFNLDLERKRVSKKAERLINRYKSLGLVADSKRTKIARFGSFGFQLKDSDAVIGTSFIDRDTHDSLMLVYFDRKSTLKGDIILGEEVYMHDVVIPKKGFYWLRSEQVKEGVYLIERAENYQQVGLMVILRPTEVGNDGGVYETKDDMENWRYMSNMPITQFYKIAVDDSEPFYYVYGGTQDNSSQGGPSRTNKAHGIKNNDWFLILDWDGHQPATEPGNPDIVYGQRQEGNLARYHRKTNEYVSIQPQASPGEPGERYNWDAPILVSAHDPKRIYHASQRIWRSDDRGNSWRTISGDLTKNENRMHMPVMDRTWSVDSGFDLLAMSNFNTIANIAESPLDENILYAGTDDGLIQVTSDGGENWQRYELDDIKGIPATAYINDIRADLFDKDTVYAALDNHKYGDYKPYLIKSTNRGKSWQSIAANLPDKHLVWRIVQDHVNKNLLFVGTEFGLFFTVDGGKAWVELTGDMPTISTRDVKIQRRENDLVAGTFGRGIYILDDYSPLRSITEKALEQQALLFPARDAWWYIPDAMHTDSQGDFEYSAKNPEFGATFTYYLKEGVKSMREHREETEQKNIKKGQYPLYPAWETVEAEVREAEPEVYLIIKDEQGNTVRKVAGMTKAGLHRVTWDLRRPSVNALGAAAGFFGDVGSLVAPGVYTASLHTTIAGKTTELAAAVDFNVKPLFQENEAGAVSPQVRTELMAEVEALRRQLSMANGQVKELLDQLNSMRTAMDRSTAVSGEMENTYQQLRVAVFAVDEVLNGYSFRRDLNAMGAAPATLSDRLFMIEFARANTWGLTATQKQQMVYVKDALAGLQPKLNELMQEQFPAFKANLMEAGAPWIPSGAVSKDSDD